MYYTEKKIGSKKTTKRSIILTLFLLIGLFSITMLFSETIAEPPSNFGEPNAGSEENPLLIANLANLRWLSEEVHYFDYLHYLQTADIDATETRYWNDGTGFKLIGYTVLTSYSPFRGVFDGNNFLINGLYVNPEIYTGEDVSYPFYGSVMFAMIQNSTIKNIHLRNFEYKSDNYYFSVGGLVYDAHGSSIINCSVQGIISVYGRVAGIGGLVYSSYGSEINNCFADVTIIYDGDESNMEYLYIGGLVALSGSLNIISSIRNSYFYGNIFNSGEIVGGGLVGVGMGNGIIENSYVASREPFKNANPIFERYLLGSFSSVFYDTETTGATQEMVDGIDGITTSEMKQASTFINAGWDLENVWDIDPNINDGYPFLRSMRELMLIVSEYEPNPNITPFFQSTVYPNPVQKDNVRIKTDVIEQNMEINIYNVRGQLINRSSDFQVLDNQNIFIWNRKDMNNNDVASGIYFYKINTDNQTTTGKFLIIK